MITLLRRFRYWMDLRDHENELAEELETHRAMMRERLERCGIHATDAAFASRRPDLIPAQRATRVDPVMALRAD